MILPLRLSARLHRRASTRAGGRAVLARQLRAWLTAYARDGTPLAVSILSPPEIRAIRKGRAENMATFAAGLGVSARTVEGWEQGRRVPDGLMCARLRALEIQKAKCENAGATADEMPMAISRPTARASRVP